MCTLAAGRPGSLPGPLTGRLTSSECRGLPVPGAGVIVAPGVLRGPALSGRFLFVKTPRGRPIRPAIAHWRAAACLNGPAFQTHGMPPASSASLLVPRWQPPTGSFDCDFAFAS